MVLIFIRLCNRWTCFRIAIENLYFTRKPSGS